MNGFFPASAVHKEKPAGLIAKCGKCGLYKGCQSPKMAPHGEGERRILFVGEAPGETEDRLGRPFVGKAGALLREVLESIGLDLDTDAWTTNALICRPPGNKTPDSKQIGYCRPNMAATLLKYRPRVVITLGRVALSSVMRGSWEDISELERWVGWRIPLSPYWVCPTYHPSYLLRSNNSWLDRMFRNHLQAALQIREEPESINWVKDCVEILMDENAVCEALHEIDRAGGWAAVDYETTCIKPEWPKARIVSCSVSNGERTISYPWHGKAITQTGRFLTSKRTRKIASNLKMEERWTWKEFGHGVRNWGWDTMLAAHCLDNRSGICSLKFQSLVQFGLPSYNRHIEPYLENHRGPYNRIADIDLRQLLLYGGLDSVLEHMLAMKQRKEMGYD